MRIYIRLLKDMVRILNVAEKNDAAKSLSEVMSGGSSRRREGFSRFNKIYEWEYNILNLNCTMTMTSVSGHLLGLEFIGQYKKWGSCNPLALFEAGVQKHCPDDFVDIKRTLEREVRGCQHLIIWTDGDREGENIGFEIIDVCTRVKPSIQVHRARFSEITRQAVERACRGLSPPDKNTSDAVDIRQELDLRTGAAFTRFQTLRLQKTFPDLLAEQVISYGSCQFPTLGFVVERYKQVQAFIPEQFWKIKVIHTMDEITTEFVWKRNRLFNHTACLVLFEQCTEIPIAEVTNVKSKPKSKWRPQALDTVEMEKLASRKLRITAKETMKIAEKLYTQGLISYPRTETNMFTKDIDLLRLVQEQTRSPQWGDFANGIVEHGPNPRNGTKTDNAHPPIHPTKYTQNLNGNEEKLYEFIVRHFLACCSLDAQGHETIVDIDVSGEEFSASGLMILARNYLDVYPYEKWTAKEMSIYRVGDRFEPSSIEMAEGETTAPPLLSEADLIALMDKHGIGTDATHADHIEKIKSRMYVGVRPDGKFVPGQLGMGLVEGYDAMGFEMSKPTLRAEFEADLKRVCEGTKDYRVVLREQLIKYKEVFMQAVQQALKIDEALSQYLGAEAVVFNQHDTGGGDVDTRLNIPVMLCPLCGQDMTLKAKKDNKGFYIACMGFPDCRSVVWLDDCVVGATVSDVLCQWCTAGPTRHINFKFKRGSVPAIVPIEYTGCIGGCDDTLDFMDIKLPRPNSTQGSSSTQHSRTGTQNNSSSSTTNSNRRNESTNTTQRHTSSNNQRQAGPQSNQSRTNPTQSGASNRSDNNLSNTSSRLNPQQSTQISSRNTNNQSSNNSARHGTLDYNAPNSSTSRRAGNSDRSLNNPHWHGDVSSDSGFSSMGSANSTNDAGSTDNDENRENIVCNCGASAILLTVRKTGPNTGRQFYKCKKAMGEGCNFFLWGDQNTNDSNHPSQKTNTGRSLPPTHKPPQPPPTASCMCNCSQDARLFTVQKEGPNKGRQFYVCAKTGGTDCKFFQWASDTGTQTSSGFNVQRGNTAQGHDNTSQGRGNTGQGRGNTGQGRGNTGQSRGRGREINDGSTKRKPTCSNCGVQGHTKRTCGRSDS